VELHKLVERHSAVAVGVCAHEARRRLPRLLSRCSLPRKLLREVLEQLRLRHAPAPVLVRCRELCELSPGRSLACMSLVVLRELLEGNSTVAVGVGAEEACSHRSRLCSRGVRRALVLVGALERLEREHLHLLQLCHEPLALLSDDGERGTRRSNRNLAALRELVGAGVRSLALGESLGSAHERFAFGRERVVQLRHL